MIHYLHLAVRSLRRNVALTVLMIVAIGFGVGASMTTLTVLHVLSGDPIPSKSSHLYMVSLDAADADGMVPGEEPPQQMTRADSEALLLAARGDRQVMMTGGEVAVEPDRADLAPFFTDGRWTSADFFAMFEAPFVRGTGWTADDDRDSARIAVISRVLAEKVFGSVDVVGKTIRAGGFPLRIVGVLDHWRPVPHYFDFQVGVYADAEDLYVPFTTSRELKFQRSGSMDCWGQADDAEAVGAPCVWIQYWVELGNAADAAAYKDYLVEYSRDRKAAGVYERDPNVRLRNVNEWLAFKKVVPRDVKLQAWLALGFLAVCLLNTVGLLLTKFMRRSGEIGVRRALGATKGSIFVQLLVEAGMIGVAGGVLGLGLASFGLWAVRQQPTPHAALAHLDPTMLIATFALALVSSLIAGMLPAWRGCQVTPALQLKSN